MGEKSATRHCWNFDDLLEKIWDCLKLVEHLHQTQRPVSWPDYTSPVVLPYSGTMVEDFCMKIHKNLIKEFKYTLVCGSLCEAQSSKSG